jgi:hypothetical protein
MTQIGVLVLSCDKYSDLWRPFFTLFFRAWPDCPFDVFLAANGLRFEDERVTTLLSGDDTDWSSSIRRSLAQVPHDVVLLLYDDAFLSERVDTSRVLQNVRWFHERGANYLRMRPLPRPDARVDGDVGLIRPGSPYRTSLFASMWKKEVLLDLLRDGESAWTFELDGIRRADALDGFYATYTNAFSYVHGVEKGRWLPWSLRYLRRHGAAPADGRRPAMTPLEAARHLARLPRGYALRLLPTAMWPAVFQLKRSLRGAFRP